jgi:hypothetical protein
MDYFEKRKGIESGEYQACNQAKLNLDEQSSELEYSARKISPLIAMNQAQAHAVGALTSRGIKYVVAGMEVGKCCGRTVELVLCHSIECDHFDWQAPRTLTGQVQPGKSGLTLKLPGITAVHCAFWQRV